jgi:hypothetical protein
LFLNITTTQHIQRVTHGSVDSKTTGNLVNFYVFSKFFILFKAFCWIFYLPKVSVVKHFFAIWIECPVVSLSWVIFISWDLKQISMRSLFFYVNNIFSLNLISNSKNRTKIERFSPRVMTTIIKFTSVLFIWWMKQNRSPFLENRFWWEKFRTNAD